MRAILADPRDGEIISQYAKLVWDLHHDRNKALCYFERAVEATPGDRYSFHAVCLASLFKFWKVSHILIMLDVPSELMHMLCI